MMAIKTSFVLAVMGLMLLAAPQIQAENFEIDLAEWNLSHEGIHVPSPEIAREMAEIAARFTPAPAAGTPSADGVSVNPRVPQTTLSADVCRISRLRDSNGQQFAEGSCAQTVIGEVPNESNMVSSIVVFPTNDAEVPERQTFTVRTKTNNFQAGFFSNPDTQYNFFPQTINAGGEIQGHSHVTIQRLRNERDVPMLVILISSMVSISLLIVMVS